MMPRDAVKVARISVQGPVNMPALIHRAAQLTGAPSNNRYILVAVCAALAKDLGVPLADLIRSLPPSRGARDSPFNTDKPVDSGQSGTRESVI